METENQNESRKNRLVLAVDDIVENLQVLGNLIRENGIKFAFAMNGEQALASIASKLPDLILLDIQMPGMTGYEVCKKLKENPATKDIPVIFLTARTEIEDIVQGFNLGGVDYIMKPFNPSELLARVFTHLDLKIAKDLILKQNKELAQLINKQNEFLGMAAHDLRNPLSIISLYAGVVEMQLEKNIIDKDKIKFNIETIHRTTERMNRLISDLLNISSIESGKIELVIRKENLIDILQENVENFKRVANEKNIQLIFQRDEDVKQAMVNIDKFRIIQVMENLLSNAVKYTYPLGEIHVSYEISGERVITHVKDTGQGLNENDINELFTSFKRLSARPTGGESSTGLGLAIVKKIIDLHAGEIRVKSVEGKGSTFSFSLKLISN
jgi:two-component system, sensor histidine kinase and response regulator